MNWKRLLNPKTNPAGYAAAASLLYAVVQGILNVQAHHKALTAPVIVAVVGSVLAGYVRTRVTPLSDPKDGNGKPLTAGAVVQVTVPPAPLTPSPSGQVQPPSTTSGAAS